MLLVTQLLLRRILQPVLDWPLIYIEGLYTVTDVTKDQHTTIPRWPSLTAHGRKGNVGPWRNTICSWDVLALTVAAGSVLGLFHLQFPPRREPPVPTTSRDCPGLPLSEGIEYGETGTLRFQNFSELRPLQAQEP